MSSSFFIKKKENPRLSKKGKGTVAPRRKGDGNSGAKSKGPLKNSKYNEEISSESETESPTGSRKRQANEGNEYAETPQEKKLRLAKLYLEQLKEEEEKKAEDDNFETDLVAGRLEEEVLEQRGKLQRLIASGGMS